MRIILTNPGIQTAVLAALLGVVLNLVGNDVESQLLIGAAVTYIVGKLQRRPHTIAFDDGYADLTNTDSEGE